ncbi:hypothetical protein QE422_002201 [Chryseobacterium sp. SORGH_AS 447]|nr:hypothetical protein [Chryseobacterium sp. SORGH_AS_0447]
MHKQFVINLRSIKTKAGAKKVLLRFNYLFLSYDLYHMVRTGYKFPFGK